MIRFVRWLIPGQACYTCLCGGAGGGGGLGGLGVGDLQARPDNLPGRLIDPDLKWKYRNIGLGRG